MARIHDDEYQKIWDEAGTLVRTLKGHEGEVRSVAWRPAEWVLSNLTLRSIGAQP